VPGLYTRMVAGALFPLHEKLKGHDTVARLHALEQSQWSTREALERQRVSRLRAFLAHAADRVPYYRTLFMEAAVKPEEIHDVADLKRLPLLTKPLIRANVDALKAGGAGPLKRYNTGGSTGEPLVFYMGRDRVSHDVAAKWRATRWWGVDIGDPEVVLWGSPIELGAQDRLRALRDRVLRTTLLPAFEMSAGNLDRFVARIEAIRPRMLFGYPSALALLARHAQAHGTRLDGLGIEVAFVTGERLYDDQRALIAKGFGCRVASGYGGRDAGFIAHECAEGEMHISAEDIIVETVDPASGAPVPAGRPGEVVVTHMATAEFPFIRYRTGDVAVLDDRSCRCGRELPLIREVQGRSTDFIVAPDGTVMHGLALIYVLRDLPEIASFKIIQESRERIRVQVVPVGRLTPPLEKRIRDGFRARLGDAVDIAIDALPEIPREASGKHRYVVSLVPQD